MKILYVTTISNTVNAFLIPHIKMLVEQGHQVDVAFNIEQQVDNELIELDCKIHEIEFSRFPFNRKNINAYKKLKRVISKEDYDIVHTHTPIASTCVRLVCRNNKNIKVFYTAHGFHFYAGAPMLNWIIYYPVERWLSRYTDTLITINKEDYNRAKKSFKSDKTCYVPGVGLDINKIQKQKVNKSKLREQLAIPKKAFLVISVGELNNNKNHKTIIEAISKLDNKNIYYAICGIGPNKKILEKLSNDHGFSENVKLLGYRTDVIDILNASDLFVFPSFREGLPVSLMEAMALNLPVVCSAIRGNNDLINHKKNGYLINPYDTEGFKEAIDTIYNDVVIKNKFAEANSRYIKKFSKENVLDNIQDIYNL